MLKCLLQIFTLAIFLQPNVIAHSQSLQNIKSITIDTIYHDEISIRAILVDDDKIWYGANKGRYGCIDLRFKEHSFHQSFENLDTEFRSIAGTSSSIFLLNAGSPACLYKISKKDLSLKLVYEADDPKSFYDSMQFWDDVDGMAVGDPKKGCFSVLITHDGGNSWMEQQCNQLPRLYDGEAAFAASNTNIVLKGKKAWMVSGGNQSRVFFTGDKGNSWTVYQTPIISGKAMTGIFSADFYDEKTGIIAGGDYETPSQNSGNKSITNDGGKTWKLISENNGPGYISCVQYIPGGEGKEMVSVGHSGLQYSSDGGNSWKQLSDDATLYTIRFRDGQTAFAAGKNRIIRIAFNR